MFILTLYIHPAIDINLLKPTHWLKRVLTVLYIDAPPSSITFNATIITELVHCIYTVIYL